MYGEWCAGIDLLLKCVAGYRYLAAITRNAYIRELGERLLEKVGRRAKSLKDFRAIGIKYYAIFQKWHNILQRYWEFVVLIDIIEFV